jgi:hypothetical protein
MESKIIRDLRETKNQLILKITESKVDDSLLESSEQKAVIAGTCEKINQDFAAIEANYRITLENDNLEELAKVLISAQNLNNNWKKDVEAF